MTTSQYPFSGKTLPHFIDGKFIVSEDSFANVSPINGEIIAQVALAERETVDHAVRAAKAALKGEWGRLSLAARCDMLNAVADGIEQRFDDFVAAEIADTGKSYHQARSIDIPRGASNFKAFAALAQSRSMPSFHTDTPDGRGAVNYSIAKPLGVVGVISPWNLPLLLLTWKVAPALACGNTIVAKPSEETPSSATLLAEVMDAVGMPPGVFNLVHGFGGGSTGEWIVSHSDIDAITFTGESSTGSTIMRAAAEKVKPISFELGGKNAAIIFEDADFEEAVAGTMRSVFANCGQVCLCSERVYVERPIFDKFVGELARRAAEMTIGDPKDGVDMGPLISHAHRQKVLGYFELAREEGAKFVTGGGVPNFGDQRDKGAYIQPTILTGLPESARCVREEIFGPVCHIAPFDSEDQVIEMANDSRYGLATAIWTRDIKRAHHMAAQMETGIVWVNEWFLRDLRTPFGGMKLSGIGREGGQHSLDFYSEPTNICVKM